MAALNYRNENYRDELVKYSYPFDEGSTLETNELYIGTDVILDASLFFKQAVELPIYISSVVGDTGQFTLYLSDSSGTYVGYCTADSEGDMTQQVYNPDGVCCGLMVFASEGVGRFAGSVANREISLLSNTAAFLPEVVNVSEAKYLRYARVGQTALDGSINIVARHGVYFDYTDSELSLNIVADFPEDIDQEDLRVVERVNDVAYRTIWLAHHPQLNMRIDVSDGILKFTHVRDETQ